MVAAKKSVYTYKGVDMDRLKKISTGPGPGGGKTWFQPKEVGIYQVRILPPVGRMELPLVEHHMHNSTDGSQGKFGGLSMTSFVTDDGYNRKITCNRFHVVDGECPVCDLADWLKQEQYDGEFIKAMIPVRSFYMNIVDRSDNEVKVWGASYSEFAAVKKAMTLRKRDPFHPDTGCDLLIQKTARKQGGKETSCSYDEDVSSIGVKGWESKATDCTELVRLFTTEEIIHLMQKNLGKLYPIEQFLRGGELVERNAPPREPKKATKKAGAKGKKK